MEVNCGCKALIVLESAGAYFDRFYSAVDAFGRAITDLENNRIDDSPQMVFDGFSGFLDRLQAAAHGLGEPSFPALAGPGKMHIMLQISGHLLGCPRLGSFQRTVLQRLEPSFLFPGHIFPVR